jgi:hypothetical protein
VELQNGLSREEAVVLKAIRHCAKVDLAEAKKLAGRWVREDKRRRQVRMNWLRTVKFLHSA